MRGTRRRVWLVRVLAVAAFLLMGAAWAVALPVNGTYDENQHIVRAYAVVDGHWFPTGRTVDAAGQPADAYPAPRSLLPANADCTWFPRTERPRSASCLVEVTDRTVVGMPSQAAPYIPVYYLLVGWPLLLSPDGTGVVLARLVSALLSALLLATAFSIAARLRNAVLLAGIVLVSTPTAMNLYGALNPNGLEISAGVLLFVALMAALTSAEPPSPAMARRLMATAGIAGFALVTARGGISPALLAAVVAAVGLTAQPGRIRALLRDRRAGAAFAVPVFAGLALFAAWTVASGAVESAKAEPGEGEGLPEYGVVDILRHIPGVRLRFWAEQVIARFNYGETTVSPAVIVVWYALVVALVAPALWWGSRHLRLAVAGLFTAGLGVLVALEVYYVPTFGWFAHSRYIMPVGVGVVLLAGASDRFTDMARARGWLGIPLIGALALTIPLDLYALLRVMSRFQWGIEFGPMAVIRHALGSGGAGWAPWVGEYVPMLAGLGGSVMLVVLTALSSGFRRSPVTGAADSD